MRSSMFYTNIFDFADFSFKRSSLVLASFYSKYAFDCISDSGVKSDQGHPGNKLECFDAYNLIIFIQNMINIS